MYTDGLFLIRHDWSSQLMSGQDPVYLYELHHRGQYGYTNSYLEAGLDLPQAVDCEYQPQKQSLVILKFTGSSPEIRVGILKTFVFWKEFFVQILQCIKFLMFKGFIELRKSFGVSRNFPQNFYIFQNCLYANSFLDVRNFMNYNICTNNSLQLKIILITSKHN